MPSATAAAPQRFLQCALHRPLRWGATLIAYRKDRLLRRGGHIILDWADLLQPQLQGRVALTDSSRELMGFALKTLGMGYNPR
eukprot:1136355-Pelagomonas_calceolata.AAC.1